MMSEADVLAATYDDLCDVYRTGLVKLKSGETRPMENQQIYSGVPCALARPSGGKAKQAPGVMQATAEYSLFIRPEIDIMKGDRVVVTRLGRTEEYIAGQAAHEPSHNNVPLSDPRNKG